LNRRVAAVLGCANAVLVFDPSAFPKRGTASVGVQRQWCGRLGKSDNCQVGVYLGYVTDWEHVLVDFQLYLPDEWAKDRKRRKRCGVPKKIRFRTRHQLALEMLERRGSMLPHGWISGDDEMGRPAWFRQELAARHENYLLAVPSNTSIRDLEAEPPPYSGHGPHPKAPFLGVRDWCEALSEESWTRLTVRDGEKGPLEVEIVKRRVKSKIERRLMAFEELLVVVRHEEGGKMKYDYHLSNATPTTPLAELARVANAEHRIEECLKRGKSEAGLGDYHVRNWLGWHHHQALSLIARGSWSKRPVGGKKAALTLPQVRRELARIFRKACGCDTEVRSSRERTLWLERIELARIYRHIDCREANGLGRRPITAVGAGGVGLDGFNGFRDGLLWWRRLGWLRWWL
jgi:SRSO17 transposase